MVSVPTEQAGRFGPVWCGTYCGAACVSGAAVPIIPAPAPLHPPDPPQDASSQKANQGQMAVDLAKIYHSVNFLRSEFPSLEPLPSPHSAVSSNISSSGSNEYLLVDEGDGSAPSATPPGVMVGFQGRPTVPGHPWPSHPPCGSPVYDPSVRLLDSEWRLGKFLLWPLPPHSSIQTSQCNRAADPSRYFLIQSRWDPWGSTFGLWLVALQKHRKVCLPELRSPWPGDGRDLVLALPLRGCYCTFWQGPASTWPHITRLVRQSLLSCGSFLPVSSFKPA